jgi:hypothetical protein
MNAIISAYPQSRYIAPVVPAERLSFDGKTKTFVGEASELGHFCGQLYDDACDTGVLIENRKTGNKVPFVLAGESRGQEGELQSWEFMVASEAVRRDSKLANLKLVVFND